MELVRSKLNLGHLLVCDFDTLGITTALDFGPHAQASSGAGRPYEIYDGDETDQRLAPPVHGDV